MNISAANLGVLIAGGAIMLFLGLAIGAIILRAACNLYNKIVGRDAVPEPGFGKAMGIILVTGLINWALSFAIGIAFSVMLSQQAISSEDTLIDNVITIYKCITVYAVTRYKPFVMFYFFQDIFQ